jgi:hypothetical protein
MSDAHASPVPFVNNPSTGSITPQFHVVFDDWFATVSIDESSLPDFATAEWQNLFGDSAYQYVPFDDDDIIEDEDLPTAALQRQQAVRQAFERTALSDYSSARPGPPLAESPSRASYLLYSSIVFADPSSKSTEGAVTVFANYCCISLFSHRSISEGECGSSISASPRAYSEGADSTLASAGAKSSSQLRTYVSHFRQVSLATLGDIAAYAAYFTLANISAPVVYKAAASDPDTFPTDPSRITRRLRSRRSPGRRLRNLRSGRRLEHHPPHAHPSAQPELVSLYHRLCQRLCPSRASQPRLDSHATGISFEERPRYLSQARSQAKHR